MATRTDSLRHVKDHLADVLPDRLSRLDFTASASCQARRRLPTAALDADPEARWKGHRVFLLDVLRSQTVPGVVKELVALVIIDNLVRRVMHQAARRQGVAPARVSFIDAWRWLEHARPGNPLPVLKVNPERPGRAEPRVRKRRPKQFPLMTRPRAELRQALLIQNDAA